MLTDVVDDNLSVLRSQEMIVQRHADDFFLFLSGQCVEHGRGSLFRLQIKAYCH